MDDICGRLFEGLLAEAGAAEGQVLEVLWHGTAEKGIHVELADVLREHEAVSAHADEEAEGRIDDIAGLHIVACPGGLDTDFLESGNPLGEDFGDPCRPLRDRWPERRSR